MFSFNLSNDYSIESCSYSSEANKSLTISPSFEDAAKKVGKSSIFEEISPSKVVGSTSVATIGPNQKVHSQYAIDLKKVNEEKVRIKQAKYESAACQLNSVKPEDINEEFKKGDRGNIASLKAFLKQGTEKAAVESSIVMGPLVKSKETIVMNAIVKNLLKDPESVKFDQREGKWFVTFQDEGEQKSRDFISLLEHADFTHISFSDDDFRNYISNRKTFCQWESWRRPQFLEMPFDRLSNPEIVAIQMYTQNYECDRMISMLMGELDKLRPYSGESKEAALKASLVNAAICVSGLNKLPSYETDYVYHGDNNPNESILNTRIQAAKERGITKEAGFFSTSKERPLKNFYSGTNGSVGIFMKGIKGKDISKISHMGNQKMKF